MQRERRTFLKALFSCAVLAAVDRRALAASLSTGLDLSQSSAHAAQSSVDAGLERVPIEHGFMLRARRYTVRYQEAEIPFLEIIHEGLGVFRLPAVCGLWSPNGKELIRDLSVAPLAQDHNGRYDMRVRVRSSLWTERSFDWSFYPGHIEFQHHAQGTAALGRCFFFSNGISQPWDNGTSAGVAANATIFAERYFSPMINLADQQYFTIALPQSVGVLPEDATEAGYHPDQWTGDFAPPPLCLVFQKGSAWTSVGLGTRPGSYLFNGLEYTGSRYAGASFYVDYHGYRTASEGFDSPKIALHFGDDEFEAMEEHVRWLDDSGFSTARRFENAGWHYLPIFCGWGEQENQTRLHQGVPHDFCTQQNYEKWIADLEAKGLPAGTIVIDDKWQKHYGTFEIDEQKWPDLKGFIRQQHAKGRHMLLWVPAYEHEGLDNSLCVLEGGRPVAADVTNPQYEAMLRARIRYLVGELEVDGFKEDWIGGVTRKPGLAMREPIIGIEFERRFQFILHDEAHRVKPDALIETQTPHPLFRESSDVLRLNDIWYGSRGVTEMMKRRARIAHIAGWPLVDCDDASSTDLEEWWNYMQAQPRIGIPSLYIVSRMKTTLEDVPERNWEFLASLWKEYIRRLGQ
jgi:Glycosyl hydrolases family 31